MFLLFGQQNRFVLIDVQNQKQYLKKDSLSAVKFLDSLAEHKYYFAKVISVKKEGESTTILFDKGENYNRVFVKINPELAAELNLKPEFETQNLDSLRQKIHNKIFDQGFVFSRVKTKYLGLKNKTPEVELSIFQQDKRKINGFVVKGYEKVPKRFLKNLEKEYKGSVYGTKNLLSIQKSLQNQNGKKLNI